MENNRNFENGFESMNEHERTVYPDYTQPSADVFEETPVQEENVYAVQGTPVHDYFSNQDTAPVPNVYQDIYSTSPETPAKPKKNRKNVALVAGTLALALCVGFGGGVLGSYVGGNSKTTVQQTGTSVSAKTTEGTDSGLNIIQASQSSGTPTSIEQVVSKVKDSVVEITTEVTKYGTFYGQYVAQGAGSGVIISSDGYIVTNNHVIEDATSIKVTLTDGNSYDAKLIGTDEELDVALIKIEADNLTVAALGTSSDLQIGETSIVIGNPLGQLGGTVTHGIISALNRSIQLDGKTMEHLQTDAAINPGNSGGGLFDANGNLIGIIVAKSTNSSDGTSLEGLGFAIPIDNVKNILGDLKTKGFVSRPVLGITAVDVLDDSTAARYNVDKQGVYIYSVTSGSAADKAGMMVGDCVLKFEDTQINSKEELSKAISSHKVGDEVKITVYRDGKEQILTAVLQENASESTQRNSNNFNKNGGNTDSDRNNNYGYPDNIEDWIKFFN